MPDVTLEPCGLEQRATLDNLFQLYTHDFSEQWAGQARGELQENGRFADYPHLDSYWADPKRQAYLVRADGAVAGLVLINDHSHSGKPVDFSVAEFFIVRKHRRGGVGSAATRSVVASKPGQWEMAVARRNRGALVFWRQVASDLAVPGTIEESDQDDDRWNGFILRFKVA